MRNLAVITMLCASACNPTTAPKQKSPKPTPKPVQPAVEPSTPDAGTPEPVAEWSDKPPVGKGLPYRMTRDGNAVEVFRGDVRFKLDASSLGDCIDGPPVPDPPEDMSLGGADDKPVWLQLRSNAEAASLMLTTRAAYLLVDDGCLRAVNVTAQLLGGADDSTDAVFSADQVAPTDAAERGGFELSTDGDSTAVTDAGTTLVRLEGLLEDKSLSALTHGESTWLRVTSGTERASKDGESATGREVVLVFELGAEGPQLRMKNDFRFGAEGADREESRTTALRASDRWHVTGLKTAVVDAMNVGAGRCPEMEGVLAFRFISEQAEWKVVGENGEARLGTARFDAMYASGCLDEARAEVKSRRKLLADKVEVTAIDWAPN